MSEASASLGEVLPCWEGSLVRVRADATSGQVYLRRYIAIAHVGEASDLR